VDAWDEVDHDSTFFVSLAGDRVVLRRLARMIRAISWGTGCALAMAPHDDDPAMAVLDVTSSEATKATGVQRVAEQVGAERIVAFGDGANDLPLFAIADEAYAVAGATDEVKAAATDVLDGDDSVARFLADRLGRAVA
jgi:hydroxymethylpyrimidine pyrophosphatase-like HAD family hydrolase